MTQTQFLRRVIKPIVFFASLAPFAWLVWGAFNDDLGANPVETITNTTGIWTLRFLAISLVITPLRWLTKWNVIVQLRRAGRVLDAAAALRLGHRTAVRVEQTLEHGHANVG